jgi:hypothetical protein
MDHNSVQALSDAVDVVAVKAPGSHKFQHGLAGSRQAAQSKAFILTLFQQLQ